MPASSGALQNNVNVRVAGSFPEDVAARVQRALAPQDQGAEGFGAAALLLVVISMAGAGVVALPWGAPVALAGLAAASSCIALAARLTTLSQRPRVARLTYDRKNPEIVARCLQAESVGRALSACERLVEARGRNPVGCARKPPRRLKTNVACWTLSTSNGQLVLLPDCMLLLEGGSATVIPYETLAVDVAQVRVLESDRVPADTYVADVQWRFIGDQMDYRKVSICEFGQLVLSNGYGWTLALQASSFERAQDAAAALAAMGDAGTAVNRTGRPPVKPHSAAVSPARKTAAAASAQPEPAARACYCGDCGFPHPPAARYCRGCGTSLNTLKPGALLASRFRVDCQIGRGAMGALYKVWDTHLEKCWALKELHSEGDSEEAMARFKSEAQMLSNLHHPGLPRAFDCFAENGCHYLMMDFVEGETLLAQVERDGAIPEADARETALRILDILAFLHGHDPPILHRDLKPANVMRACDRLMLVDFSIARWLRGNGTGTAIGTAGYAPPEQYRGEADARSDLYALAATVHHLLSGKAPSVPFVFDPVEGISEGMQGFLYRALRMNSDERFQSAEEMRAALLPPSNVVERTVGGPTTMLLAPAFEVQAEGMCHAVALSPDGRHLAVGSHDVRLCAVDDGQVVQQVQAGQPLASTAFSPDGALLAAGSVSGTVFLWRVPSGEEVMRFDAHTDLVTGLAFSPDGSFLASTSLDGALQIYDLAAGQVRHVGMLPGHQPRCVACSPDGTRIATACTRLVLWDAASGRHIREVELLEGVEARSVAFVGAGAGLACACSDGTVRLHVTETLQVALSLQGHQGQVLAVAASADGRLLASGATDATACLWEAPSGLPLGRLEGHGGVVSSLSFSEDGKLLATGSLDQTVRVFRL
ncbi:MAG: hypothetical protein FJX76_10660 [Armatimonadetes bacterium]|nr:hypothetical protein [Armatimonadota bacterium]